SHKLINPILALLGWDFNILCYWVLTKELEKIELIRQPNGNYKLDHAVTATQKVILGAFGLDEKWIKAQARQIGKDIQNAAMPEEQKDD
ncbi:hypothetical protein QP717_10530, partial [Lactobacillus delbrueckii]|nr:hypothetical protein [Lactobacillus delbrueckii]